MQCIPIKNLPDCIADYAVCGGLFFYLFIPSFFTIPYCIAGIGPPTGCILRDTMRRLLDWYALRIEIRHNRKAFTAFDTIVIFVTIADWNRRT